MARVTSVQTPEFRPNSPSSQASKSGDPFAMMLDTVSAKRATAPEPRRRADAQDTPRVSGAERPERPQPQQDARPVAEKAKPAASATKNAVKGEACAPDCTVEAKDTDSGQQTEGAAAVNTDTTAEDGSIAPVVIEGSPEAPLDDQTASDDTPDDSDLLADAGAGVETDPNATLPAAQQVTSADAAAVSVPAGPAVVEVFVDAAQESAAVAAAVKAEASAGKQSNNPAGIPAEAEAAPAGEQAPQVAAPAEKPEESSQAQKPVASNHAETRDAAMAEKSEQTAQSTSASKPEAPAQAKEHASAKPADHASIHSNTENSSRQQVMPQTTPVLPEPVRALAGSINPVNLRAANEGAENAVQLNANAIGVEIASRAKEGMRRFDIRLDPPELGRIDVRLEVDNHGKASTRLIVERPETLDLLQRDARNLERALQSAGLQTEDGSLQFSLQDHGQNGLADAGSNEGYDRRDQYLASAIDDAEQAPPAVEAYARSVLARGGVDIRI